MFQPAPRPRFSALINRTSGKRSRTKSTVPSRDPLSTTIVSTPRSDSRQGSIQGRVQVSCHPYQTGINIKVDHLQYGDSIDSSDYGIPAFLSGFATISSDNRKEWKEVAVTSQVNDDIANTRSLSQFRLHFSKELRGEDETGEFAFFESSENFLSTGNTPQLIIKYY